MNRHLLAYLLVGYRTRASDLT